MRRDAFSHYHPIVNMLYFVLVIGAGMALRHGVCQVLGLVLAFSYCIALEGAKVWKMLRWLVPLCLCSTIINMFVSHEGPSSLPCGARTSPWRAPSMACPPPSC